MVGAVPHHVATEDRRGDDALGPVDHDRVVEVLAVHDLDGGLGVPGGQPDGVDDDDVSDRADVQRPRVDLPEPGRLGGQPLDVA